LSDINDRVIESFVNRSLKRVLIVKCVLGSSLENFLNANVLEGACLNIGLGFLRLNPLVHNLIFLHSVKAVDLISNQHNWYLSGLITCRLGKGLAPLIKVLIGLNGGNVEDQNAPIAAPIK
jgi:hypothetical protein